MPGLIRSLLFFAILVAVVILVAMHGFVRALALAMALALVTTVPKTRGWKMVERWLVRLTGSRRRAAVLALVVVVGVLAAVNVYSYLHGG